MGRGRDAEVVVQLAVDVLQTPRHGSHAGIDGEREPDRMPGRRVRILPDDEHPHVGERGGERPQHVLARGQVAAPGRGLGAQEVAELGDAARGGRERLRPAGIDELGEGAGICHALQASH